MERKKEFKFYEAPEMEVVDVELEGYLLEASETEGSLDDILGGDTRPGDGGAI